MPHRKVLTALVLIATTLVLMAAAGCSSSAPTTTTSSAASESTATALSGVALGKQLYTKGVDANGQQAMAAAPAEAQGAMLLGGGGCAACHGDNGAGATVRAASGQAISAPDIRYASLIKAGFNDASIRYAIQWGTDEIGSPLDPTMPPWQLSDASADAVVAYLKTLK